MRLRHGSRYLVYCFVLLSLARGTAASDSTAPTATVAVLDLDGSEVDVLSVAQPAQVQLVLSNLPEADVTGSVVFTATPAAAAAVITTPFGATLCRVTAPQAKALQFLCPLGPRPPLPDGAVVDYALSRVCYTTPKGPLTDVLPLPSLTFQLVDSIPDSDPLVLRLYIGLGPGTPSSRFRRADFVAAMLVACQLPRTAEVEVLDVTDIGMDAVQVVLSFEWANGDVAVLLQRALRTLNSNDTAQQLLGVVRPAMTGTDCPEANNQTCNGQGLCQYLDGTCACAATFQGTACEQRVPTTDGFPTATIAIGATIAACWGSGWLLHKALWMADYKPGQRYRRKEQFTRLSPLHRTTTGTLLYRTCATVYVALCVAGCAFPRTSLWYPSAGALFLPQVTRLLRLDIPNTPHLPIVAYVLVLLFVPYCVYLNKRLAFLVNMDLTAWHRPLTFAATQKLAAQAMTWRKPRLKPPGYTPHYALLLIHLFYPTLSPLIFGLLMSTFVCDQIDGAWVARIDHSVACFTGAQVAHAVIAGVCLLLYYGAFMLSSYMFVAATERLQQRNLELGLPSLIRDRRSAFIVVTQIVGLVIAADVFISHVGPQAFLVAGLAVCAALAVALLAYQFLASPCNIPLCNWISISAHLFPIWCYVLVIPTFFISSRGLVVDEEVLAGMWLGHVLLSLIFIALMYRTSRGLKGQAPAWFAIRMAEASKREQTELNRLNSSRHLSKDELDINPSGLPTPHSVPATPRRRQSPLLRPEFTRPRQQPGASDKKTLLEAEPGEEDVHCGATRRPSDDASRDPGNIAIAVSQRLAALQAQNPVWLAPLDTHPAQESSGLSHPPDDGALLPPHETSTESTGTPSEPILIIKVLSAPPSKPDGTSDPVPHS